MQQRRAGRNLRQGLARPHDLAACHGLQRRLQWQRLEHGIAELQAGSQALRHVGRQRRQHAEAPAGLVAQQHHAVFVGDENGRVRLAPVGLQIAEIHLQHHHAEHGTAVVVDAAGQVEASLVADGAQREMLGGAMRDRALEIGPELIVDANEGGRFPPVAGGNRVAVPIQYIDGRGAHAVAEGVEFFVQRFDQGRRWGLQCGAQIHVTGQDKGQGAELVQVVAQQGGVDLTGATRL